MILRPVAKTGWTEFGHVDSGKNLILYSTSHFFPSQQLDSTIAWRIIDGEKQSRAQ